MSHVDDLLDRIEADLQALRKALKAATDFHLTSEPLPKTRKAERRASSLEEVINYGQAKQIARSDCVYFWNHCEGNNWTINGRSMHNWKATLVAWRTAHYLPSLKNGNGNGH
jgi:hypothetical protein